PAFDLLGEKPIQVGYQGKDHTVNIRYSVSRAAPRQQGGNSAIGRDAARNQGVSVVRARRELEMNHSFDSRSDPRDRWWGIEVLVEPELDDVFGVTNNKQAATSFGNLNLVEDAAAEDMSPIEYKDRLKESQDPRLAIYEISHEINKLLEEVLWPQIKRIKEPRKQSQYTPPPGSAEDAGTKAVTSRRAQVGDKGESDKAERLPV